jgi:hypothetical protein
LISDAVISYSAFGLKYKNVNMVCVQMVELTARGDNHEVKKVKLPL